MKSLSALLGSILLVSATSYAQPNLSAALQEMHGAYSEFTNQVVKMSNNGALEKHEAHNIQMKLSKSQKAWAEYASAACALSTETEYCRLTKIHERTQELQTQMVHVLSGE